MYAQEMKESSKVESKFGMKPWKFSETSMYAFTFQDNEGSVVVVCAYSLPEACEVMMKEGYNPDEYAELFNPILLDFPKFIVEVGI